jgi:RNA polymerase sigma-70 factor (ECF subfamily)
MADTASPPTAKSVADQFRRELLAAIPRLRAFAFSLSGRRDDADDLVQETLVKAWANHGSFQLGTNLQAWVYTILRNEFYSRMRKRGREVADVDGAFSRNVGVPPNQLGHLDLCDMHAALARLPAEQRESLLLVAASGFSYEEAATICGVATGTVKSRVNRARAKLADILNIAGENEFGPDAMTESVLARPLQSKASSGFSD